jgi:aspartate--ammonia ligase
MNAVRPDEVLDNMHSIYVDQWDWEKIITRQDRSLDTLKGAVRAIYEAICRTEFHIASRYPQIRPVLPDEIVFCTTEELADRYPDLEPREREDRICAEHRAVFLIGIGADLADGRPHDGRAPDYDDWTTPRPDGGRGLNGDILLWNPVLERAFEISSMGIRVESARTKSGPACRSTECSSMASCPRPWEEASANRDYACSTCVRPISARWRWEFGRMT